MWDLGVSVPLLRSAFILNQRIMEHTESLRVSAGELIGVSMKGTWEHHGELSSNYFSVCRAN